MDELNKLTETTPQDFAEAWKDEHGVLYSKDRKRLLRSTNPNLMWYDIPEGTEVICKNAFSHVEEEECESKSWRGYTIGYLRETNLCKSFIEVSIPASVRIIGYRAFYYCENLAKVHIAPGLKEIRGEAFCYCFKLKDLILPNTIEDIDYHAFKGCNKNRITLPKKFQHQKIWIFDK